MTSPVVMALDAHPGVGGEGVRGWWFGGKSVEGGSGESLFGLSVFGDDSIAVGTEHRCDFTGSQPRRRPPR